MATIALVCVAPSSRARTQFNAPATINYAINNNVAIGLGTSSPFTVTVEQGANIGGYLYGSGNSTVDLTGGSIGTYLQADANSVFNIYGSSLTISNQTPYFTGTQYTLTGVLQDGDPINLSAYSYNNGQFILHNAAVPEASSVVSLGVLLALGLGGLVLCARRRKATAAG